MSEFIWCIFGMLLGASGMWVFSWITDLRSYWRLGKKGIKYGIEKGAELLDRNKKPSIPELIQQYPNDMELGKRIRESYKNE